MISSRETGFSVCIVSVAYNYPVNSSKVFFPTFPTQQSLVILSEAIAKHTRRGENLGQFITVSHTPCGLLSVWQALGAIDAQI